MKKDSSNQDSEKEKFQRPNQVLKKIFGTAKKRFEDLRNHLSGLNLEELAEFTGMIGNEVNQAFISIGLIVTELRRRTKENNETIEVEVNNKLIVVSPFMPEEDEKNLVNLIQNSVENGAAVKYFRGRKVSNSETNSCQTDIGLDKIKDDVQGFQEELNRLKRL